MGHKDIFNRYIMANKHVVDILPPPKKLQSLAIIEWDVTMRWRYLPWQPALALKGTFQPSSNCQMYQIDVKRCSRFRWF